MHKISHLWIENFKSIYNANFIFTDYTPLVGYNNAGKTNILNALEWMIKKSSLSASDFYDREHAVTVIAEISGIDADVLDNIGGNHRQKIEPLVSDGKLMIRRTQLEPGAPVKDIRFEILERTDAGDQWRVNPAGIDSAISHLFPEPIFIGAMENATEDVAKYASGTTIGKLLREIIGPIGVRHAGSIKDALDSVGKKLSANGDEKDGDLVDLDTKIQTELEKFFPGVSAKTHISVPEFSDFLKGATIRLFEDNFENKDGRDASSFGHGAQRSVQIALLKCLSDIKRDSAGEHNRTTLLLIDEPELYLHPQAVEVVRASLRKLSGEGYQIAFSTHSANMISRNDAPYVLLVRRNQEAGTYAIPRLQDAVQRAIADAKHQSELLFSLTHSNKILFSEGVVLAEGKTEQTVLPDLFLRVRGITFDEAKLALVSLGGAENIINAISVLSAMGIPTKAIADLDFAFRGAVSGNLISKDDPSIEACRTILGRLQEEGKISLGANGLPVKHNGDSAATAFELLSSEADAIPHISLLHDTLKNLGIWVWKNGAIEAHLDLLSKQPAAHMEFLQQIDDPAFLTALSDFDGVQELFKWLHA